MLLDIKYDDLLRMRLTQIRLEKNLSERRMSLDLGKSSSYVRGITNGKALPSLRELFNIIEYFEMTPAEFFSGMTGEPTPRTALQDKLAKMSDEDIEKVSLFISWISD